MPLYAVKTTSAWVSDASLNGATFFDISDPGDLTSLTNGTGYQAREVRMSDLSAEFIPTASSSFGITYIGGVSSSVPPAGPTVLSLPVGATNANRWAVASLHFLHAPSINLLGQITINGENVVILRQNGGLSTNNQGQTIVWVRSGAKITTGTTAELSIPYLTAPASDAAVRAEGYRLIAANAPTLAASDVGTGTQTIDVTVATGDILLVGATSDNLAATPDASSFTGGPTFRAATDLRSNDFASIADTLSVTSGGALTISTPAGRKAGIVLRETP